jgi:peptidoglycan-associated lipoprotein
MHVRNPHTLLHRSALGATTLAATLLGACAASTSQTAATANPQASRGGPSTPSDGAALAPSANARCSLTAAYFPYDSNELDSTARAVLERNAECIKRAPGTRAVIVGMTDARGSEDYNLALGERRAQTAIRYLSAMGVDMADLDSRSTGEEYAAGSDESGWASDRRSDISTP